MYSRKEVDPTRKTIDLVHWREQYVNSWNTFFTVILWNVSKGMAFSVVDSQHGFRSGRSMEMQLVYTFHDIAKAWMRMHLYHWPFLDFSKPSDKFPLLLLRIRCGVRVSLLSDISVYYLIQPSPQGQRSCLVSHRALFWGPCFLICI